MIVTKIFFTMVIIFLLPGFAFTRVSDSHKYFNFLGISFFIFLIGVVGALVSLVWGV